MPFAAPKESPIAWVGRDDDDQLHVAPEDQNDQHYRSVYRAGLCVWWSDRSRSFWIRTIHTTWSLEQRYENIVTAAVGEVGPLFVLTERTEYRGLSTEEIEILVAADQRLRAKDWTPTPPSTAVLAAWAGDDRVRAEARECFRAKDWQRVVELLESVRYPSELTMSERRMLELARARRLP